MNGFVGFGRYIGLRFPPVVGADGASAVLDWYIAVDGNDSNDGRSPGAPLASLDGLIAAIGAQLLPLGATITVHVGPGSYPTPSSGIFDFLSKISTGAFINFQGSRTYVGGARTATPAGSTGTVSAVTQWDGTAKTEGLVTISSGIDFSVYNSDTGYCAEIVGGARDGQWYQIEWLSSSAAIGGSALKFKTPGHASGMPQVGDVLRIYSCSQFPGACLLGTANYFDLDFGPHPFVVHSLTLGASSGTFFQGCILRGLDAGAFGEKPFMLFEGCVIYRSHFSGSAEASRTSFRGGVELRFGGTLTLDAQCHVLNSGFVVGVDSTGGVILVGICSFELLPTSFTVTCRSYVRATAQCWFRDSAGLAASIILSSGSLFTYSVLPAFVGSGATTDVNVGSVSKAAAGLPFYNGNCGAGLVPEVGQ